jgi:hypothetical protein
MPDDFYKSYQSLVDLRSVLTCLRFVSAKSNRFNQWKRRSRRRRVHCRRWVVETGNGNRENSLTKIIQVKSRLDVVRLRDIQIIRYTLGESNKMLLWRLAFYWHFLYNSHNNIKPRNNKICRISQREMGSEKGKNCHLLHTCIWITP